MSLARTLTRRNGRGRRVVRMRKLDETPGSEVFWDKRTILELTKRHFFGEELSESDWRTYLSARTRIYHRAYQKASKGSRNFARQKANYYKAVKREAHFYLD